MIQCGKCGMRLEIEAIRKALMAEHRKDPEVLAETPTPNLNEQ